MINPNTWVRSWKLNEDMQEKQCNDGEKIYYQDYEYFFVDGVRRNNCRAVWNPEQEKMLFFYDGAGGSDDYICNNLDSFTSLIGQDLVDIEGNIVEFVEVYDFCRTTIY